MPLTRGFLVPGEPTYLGDAANIFAGPMLWNAFGNLTETVRAGGSLLEQHAEIPSHPFWETFARSSAALAFPAATALAEQLAPVANRDKPFRVLDVAAGSGIYGYTFLRSPNVDVTFVDWPNVLPRRAPGASDWVPTYRARISSRATCSTPTSAGRTTSCSRATSITTSIERPARR
jgi:C-methyltransferase